ncbi:MAG: SO_0444 family Cu/Zn efflux transporter [Gammaproteobacteria bacterium]|nr:SO_0444 family Cu/Zn efflux transporter [Gammaproteobacteria bacterium]
MLEQAISTAAKLATFFWDVMLELSPVILLGLFLSGLIHVFISRQAVMRWLQKDNFGSIATSAAVGVPIPLCSCSVLPVVAEMRNKGASRSACMSFLITAPETGADSILITNVFFGWIAAITRPVVSFITAVVAGLFCVGLARQEEKIDRPALVDDCCDAPVVETERCETDVTAEDDCCAPGAAENEFGTARDASGHEYLVQDQEDCYVSLTRLREATTNSTNGFLRALRSLSLLQVLRPQGTATRENPKGFDVVKIFDGGAQQEPLTLRKVARHVFRYGFVNIADDILFALLVGVFLGGIIFLFVPSGIGDSEFARWISYPVMLLLGVPLYICASASTPMAAAMVAKGISPGAALIFLMTGPATNTATISVVLSQFGPRFATIYVVVVMSVTAIVGIGIDFLLMATGFQIFANLEHDHSHAIQYVQYASVVAFAALVVWRFRAGALKRGWNDMMSNFRSMGRRREIQN